MPPSIACIGVIGKHSNPLHISLFATTGAVRAPLEFSLLLSSALDVFEARAPHITVDQDFGLLQAVDERLAMYGWLTNTGVKLVVVVDMDGRADDAPGAARGRGAAAAAAAKIEAKGGLRDADLKPVFRALQTAYIALLRNPFYSPDDHTPRAAAAESRVGSTQITSRRFVREVQRIGEVWAPGVTNI